MSQASSAPAPGPIQTEAQKVTLFWACFAALVATSFAFMIRSSIVGVWQAEFHLTGTQIGEINGAGLWPFAISIILFSLVLDKIGYGRAMIFAFVCHTSSVVITIFAPRHFDAYHSLYAGNFIAALAAGTVEAVANPVVATMFSKNRIKWLNMLHGGWAGGLVLAGIIVIAMGSAKWEYKVALLLIPTLFYGIFMLGKRFPIQERVAAGVSYKAMLQEAGFFGWFVAAFLVISALTSVFLGAKFEEWKWGWMQQYSLNAGLAFVASIPFGLYVRTLGRPIFLFLLLIMIPQATTELGIDGWVTNLMETPMKAKDLNPAWVLVYTSFIMLVLRFSAGAIVHRVKPLMLLAICSAIAVVGLMSLSWAAGLVMIFVAATIYGVGKTFFWPTILGVVSEQYPRGGALTLNTIGGVGMLGVGVIGMAMFGNVQDRQLASELQSKNNAIYQVVKGDEKGSVLGTYTAVDMAKVDALGAADKQVVTDLVEPAKKSALRVGAALPAITFVCYLILIGIFAARGGYKPVDINAAPSGSAAP